MLTFIVATAVAGYWIEVGRDGWHSWVRAINRFRRWLSPPRPFHIRMEGGGAGGGKHGGVTEEYPQ
jgi:hypothetical protein